ncbi:sulfate ABC transporter permease subunit [Spongisporangium articulatum]|uniref:Sulfate ABC transporter permease subunit n=1 Tax=Spongisporangium articulatum TaxID=3362603 RepID=A0ABW8AI13_9ACTN
MADTLERPAAQPDRPRASPRRIRRRRGNPLIRWTLRLVAVVYVAALVALPVFTVTKETFGNGLDPVLEAVSSPDFVAAVKLTLLVAGLAVLLNTVFGLAVSYLLVRYRFPGRGLLNTVIDLPVSISPVVVGLALILVYGTTGWFGTDLESVGIQIIFSTPGMVIATVVVALPLVVREIIPVLEEAGLDQDQAAQSLGANAVQRFLRITLPTIKWALAYGVVLSLARSLGEFGAVRVVSSSIAQESQTVTLYINDQYQEFGPKPEQAAFAAAFTLMITAIVFIAIIAALRPKDK